MKKAFILLALQLLFSLSSRCQTFTTTVVGGGSFVPVDSANKMISSYLGSIDTTSGSTDIRSLIFSASSLRDLLNDNMGKAKIVAVKFIFAHTLDYINSGNKGEPCGYKSGCFTLVLAAYDEDGNVVYYPEKNKVLDTCAPCPSICPVDGTASENLLPKL